MRFLVALSIAACILACSASADTTVDVRVGTSGFEFGFLYSDYYGADERVVREHTEWLSESDFVVALHLARLSGRDLDLLVEWRRGGRSWSDITHRCELTADVYRVELTRDPGPPYGRAWGYWKKHPKKSIELSDEEIRAFVVLKAMSDFTRKPAAEIVRLQNEGWTPRKIANGKVAREDASAPPRGQAQKNKNKKKK
jgi:hypothetical protein